ncbi:hypothetical protein ACFFUT_15750 [Pseudohalocynthiibacter aestuariivivens]|jgi:hypothetical protein|uniref:Uncharacterized protein n=1 Tax=Pseudohalocynthiibacter aestuariivivens TaxID=1591409 RepID=A0ABV5JIG5_9RHOB|nr:MULTISPECIES: hypothetical protein [Pseudohalocynthiibacter]MBS9716475.1 hypothetical protein [Pseudohalocynthiibacter aestuariivivens]MCK0101545.1 hypothetical protein [Pseudohalocynthiibacter sp. F2068]
MNYEVTLESADIRDTMDGEMRFGLLHNNSKVAEVSYHWDATHFTATFHGHAPSLPEPAHPTVFIQQPIAAIQMLKTEPNVLPTDVFNSHRVFISGESKG